MNSTKGTAGNKGLTLRAIQDSAGKIGFRPLSLTVPLVARHQQSNPFPVYLFYILTIRGPFKVQT